mgnify:CR=1 FL=1|jgi:hypothetical protein
MMYRELLESVLYQWCCGNISTKDAKRITKQQGIDIDFREQIFDNVIIGYNAKTGREERFEV